MELKMDGWMDGRTDGWVGGWMDGYTVTVPPPLRLRLYINALKPWVTTSNFFPLPLVSPIEFRHNDLK